MTDAYLSKLRQAARKLKRSSGIAHYAALDQVAKAEGHDTWAELALAASTGAATSDVPASLTLVNPKPLVVSLPIRNSATYLFHHVGIETMRFAGLAAAGGPFINAMNNQGEIVAQVALGVCSIANIRDGTEWWVCKYDNQPHINITALSEAGRNALAFEFGIGRPRVERAHPFLYSPAFQSLAAWARSHPRRARRAAETAPHLSEWYERATGKTIPRPKLDPEIQRRIDALFASRGNTSPGA